MIKILAVFNGVTETTIPVENFILLNNEIFEKKFIVINNSEEDVKACLQKKGDYNSFRISSLFNYKNKILNHNFYKKLIFLINEFNPDIIHVHHTFSAIVILLLRIFFLKNKTKIVLTMHNDYRFYKFWQKFIFSIAIKLADHIIANSKNTLHRVKHLITKKNYSVIYNGVNEDKITSIKKKNNESIVIGTVGRLVPQKDYDTLLKCIKYVVDHNKNRNLKFYIIGDGFLRNQIANKIQSLNLIDYVIMTGPLERNEVYKRLNLMDIFIVSSKFEGFCNAMVESMIAGCAIISTNANPLPEVIGGPENGVLVDVGDYEKMGAEVIRLCKDSKSRLEYGNRAKQYALTNYSMNKCVTDHTVLYKKLMNDN